MEGEGGFVGENEVARGKASVFCERAPTETKLVHTSARVVLIAVSLLQVSFTFYRCHLLSTGLIDFLQV